jgi:hypothetical protein
VGEINPNYLDWEPAINRMARDIPNALLFAILRSPVERAVSAYHFFRETLFPGQSFAEACRSSVYLIKLGLYARHLKRVFVYFPRRQVKILFYDDVQQKPAQVLAELYRFLGVDDKYVPRSLRVVYNSAYFPTTTTAWKRTICGCVNQFIKNTSLGRWVRRSFAPKRVSNYDGIAKRDLLALVEAFHEDIEELEEMTGRDLSSWLAPAGIRSTRSAPSWQEAMPAGQFRELNASALRPMEVIA